MINTEPTSFVKELPSYLYPIPYLGCIGEDDAEASSVFTGIGTDWLRRNPKKTVYTATFITEENLTYYSKYDQLPISVLATYKYMNKLTKEGEGKLRKYMRNILRLCTSSLRSHGMEVSWSPEDGNVFYIDSQKDLELVTFCSKTNTLLESYVSSIYEEAKKLRVSPEVTSIYIHLIEELLRRGMYPWELDEGPIANLYNRDSLLLLSETQLSELLEKVKHGQYRLK